MPGRNDPCPCGSGKKYKRCCLAETVPALPAAARSIRDLQRPLEDTMLRFAREALGDDALDRAASAFGEERADAAGEDPDLALFLPWFLYTWMPEPVRVAARPSRDPDPTTDTIAARLLAERRATLGVTAARFIEATIRAPFSFHDVIATDPGRTIRLRDIFLDREADVAEESGSRMLQPGDILYGRVVAIDGVHLLIGSGSVVIPPIEKGPLLGFRERIRSAFGTMTAGHLHIGEPQLRSLYLAVADRLLHPAAPVLQNTDGDPILLQTIRYEIESPEEAFRALKDLALAADDEELLAEARRDASGALVAVRFPWLKRGNRKHKSWESTVLGEIVIEGTSLRISVNSARRAKRIRREVGKRLTGHARHVATSIQPQEALWKEARKDRGAKTVRGGETEEFEQTPEGAAILREVMSRHYETWPDEPVPALGGKTPRQAVKDPAGREMVEALLLQFERDERRRPEAVRYDFNRLRERLGIRPRSTA